MAFVRSALLLLSAVPFASSWASFMVKQSLYCSRSLIPGVYYMAGQSEQGSGTMVLAREDGSTIRSGETYSPGELVSVTVSNDLEGTQFVAETSAGEFTGETAVSISTIKHSAVILTINSGLLETSKGFRKDHR